MMNYVLLLQQQSLNFQLLFKTMFVNFNLGIKQEEAQDADDDGAQNKIKEQLVDMRTVVYISANQCCIYI